MTSSIVWNKDETGFCDVRELSAVNIETVFDDFSNKAKGVKGWKVWGRFRGADRFFDFGLFDTKPQAKTVVARIRGLMQECN